MDLDTSPINEMDDDNDTNLSDAVQEMTDLLIELDGTDSNNSINKSYCKICETTYGNILKHYKEFHGVRLEFPYERKLCKHCRHYFSGTEALVEHLYNTLSNQSELAKHKSSNNAVQVDQQNSAILSNREITDNNRIQQKTQSEGSSSAGVSTTSALGEISTAPSNCNSNPYEKKAYNGAPLYRPWAVAQPRPALTPLLDSRIKKQNISCKGKASTSGLTPNKQELTHLNKRNQNTSIPETSSKKTVKNCNVLFYCDICDSCVHSEVKLELHVNGRCKNFGNMSICPQCGLKFSFNEYQTHMKLQVSHKLVDFKFIRIRDRVQLTPPVPKYPLCSKCTTYHIDSTEHICSDTSVHCEVCNQTYSQSAFDLHTHFHQYPNATKTDRPANTGTIPLTNTSKVKNTVKTNKTNQKKYKLYSCSFCKVVTDTQRGVNKHLKEHYLGNVDPNVGKCRECNLSFIRASFVKHKRLHKEVSNLNKSMFEIINMKNMFQTPKCNTMATVKETNNQRNVKVLLFYRCVSCDTSFQYKTYADRHNCDVGKKMCTDCRLNIAIPHYKKHMNLHQNCILKVSTTNYYPSCGTIQRYGTSHIDKDKYTFNITNQVNMSN